MKFSTFRYYIEEAMTSLVRNGLMSVTSIITVASCVFIIMLSFTVASTLEYSVANLEDKIGMTIFINEKTHADELKGLREEILAIDGVESVNYVSKDEALARFKEGQKEHVGVLDHFDTVNPLPRSFELMLLDNENASEVILELESSYFLSKGVDEVVHQLDTSASLLSFNRGVRITSIVLVLSLVFLSIVIIMNTITLTVNSRKSEIGIMKFIGATDAFIKWPFIIEGIIFGLIGALLPIVIGWVAYGPVIEKIILTMPVQFSGLLVFRPAMEIFPFISPVCIVFGAMLGAFGSIASIRRYLFV